MAEPFAELVVDRDLNALPEWDFSTLEKRIEVMETEWRWNPQVHPTLSAFARHIFSFPSVLDLSTESPKDALRYLTDGAWEVLIITSKLNMMLTKFQFGEAPKEAPLLNRYRSKLARIEAIMRLCLKTCMAEVHAYALANDQTSPMLLESVTHVTASLNLEEKPSYRTRLFQEVSEVFAMRKLKIYKGRVYQPINTPDGQYRFCYEQCMVGGEEDIKDAGKVLPWIIHYFRNCEWSLDDLFLQQDGTNPLALLRELATNIEQGTVARSFPRLEPDMTAVGYLNGVYMADIDRFYRFELVPNPDLVCGTRVECMYDPKWDDETLDDVANLKDEEMTDFQMFSTMIHHRIPTPLMDSVLKYHDIDDEGIAHTYAWGGKLRYKKMTHDNWQREIMALGPPGCGKSLLVHVWRKCLPVYAVASLSSNMQEKFGVSAIAGCTTYINSETTSEFGRNVSAGEFASMISGEEVSLNVKFDKPLTVQWLSNGLFAGNEPPFLDNVGKMIRRFFIVPMSKALPNEKQDGSLLERILNKELGALIKKNNVLYLRLAHNHGQQDPTAWMTAQFKHAIESFAMDSNPLMGFLRSTKVVHTDQSQYIDVNEFKTAFFKWSVRMGHKHHTQLTTTVLNGSLGQMSSRIGPAPDDDPVLSGKTVIYGLALVDDDPGHAPPPQQAAVPQPEANGGKRQRGFV